MSSIDDVREYRQCTEPRLGVLGVCGSEHRPCLGVLGEHWPNVTLFRVSHTLSECLHTHVTLFRVSHTLSEYIHTTASIILAGNKTHRQPPCDAAFCRAAHNDSPREFIELSDNRETVLLHGVRMSIIWRFSFQSSAIFLQGLGGETRRQGN